jgi:hypothetical protein
MSLSNNFEELYTVINIKNKAFNLSKLKYIQSNSNIISNKKSSSNLKNIHFNRVSELDNLRFNVANIDKITIVILIQNEAALFSINSYLELILDTNINLLIKPSENFQEISNILYTNIYKNDNNYKYIFFTNNFYKNIPINSINLDTVYIFDKDYNIDNKLECLYVKNSNIKKELLLDKYEYQKFTDKSILWIINKFFNLDLHKMNTNIIIATYSFDIIEDVSYIFISNNVLKYLELYYNWFSFTYASLNLQLSDFIILIFGYYFNKQGKSINLSYNCFINNKTSDTISIKSKRRIISIQNREKITGNFIHYCKHLNNNFGDTSISFFNKTETMNIILVKNLENTIIDNNNLIIKLELNVNDINLIRTKYPYLNIWIFDNISQYKNLVNDFDRFPSENIKIANKNNYIYRIVNNFKYKNYRDIRLDDYIIKYNYNVIKKIVNIDKIDTFQSNTIVSVLLENKSLVNYFIDYYRKKNYLIVLVNIFKLDISFLGEISNVIVLDNLEKLDLDNKCFVLPNYFYENILSKMFKVYKVIFYKDIHKKYETFYLKLDNNNNEELSNLFILNMELNIRQKLSIVKFYSKYDKYLSFEIF